MMLKNLFTSSSSRYPVAAIAASVLFLILIISIRVFSWSFNFTDEKMMKNVLPELYQARNYDIVTVGSSHVGEMKFNTNLKSVSDVLEKDILVMGKAGQGVLPMELYLDTFFHYGNDADTILFFLDSFLFSHVGGNEGTPCVQNEPLDLYFTPRLFELGFELPAIMSHVAYNVNIKHLYTPIAKAGKEPIPHTAKFETNRWLKRAVIYEFDNIDYVVQNLKRFDALLKKYSHKEIVIIKPPLHFPAEMVDANIKKFLKLFYEHVDVSPDDVIDHTYLVKDSKYFRDMDHLNSPGWKYYAEVGLKPVFDSK
jgi:hypothetical protein